MLDSFEETNFAQLKNQSAGVVIQGGATNYAFGLSQSHYQPGTGPLNTIDHLPQQQFNNSHQSNLNFHSLRDTKAGSGVVDPGVSSNNSRQRGQRNRNSYPPQNNNNDHNTQTSIVVRNQINIINNGSSVAAPAQSNATNHVHAMAQ